MKSSGWMDQLTRGLGGRGADRTGRFGGSSLGSRCFCGEHAVACGLSLGLTPPLCGVDADRSQLLPAPLDALGAAVAGDAAAGQPAKRRVLVDGARLVLGKGPQAEAVRQAEEWYCALHTGVTYILGVLVAHLPDAAARRRARRRRRRARARATRRRPRPRSAPARARRSTATRAPRGRTRPRSRRAPPARRRWRSPGPPARAARRSRPSWPRRRPPHP